MDDQSGGKRVIRGTVSRLFHQSVHFCAGRLVPNRSDVASPGEIVFAGKVYVREGEAVALRGAWVDHEKYGRQFKITERLTDEGGFSPEGLAAWLQVHGEAHGIGPRKAKKIAEEFGESFTGWLRDDPEQVAIAASVPLETVKALAKSWEDQEQLNAIGVRLAKYELTANQIHALFAKFGGGIVAILEDDPYLIVGHVPGLGFKRVDEIARKLGVPPSHPGRIDAAITFALGQAADGDGSTCLDRDSLVDSVLEATGREGGEAAGALIEERLAVVVKEKEPKVVEVAGRGGSWYALAKYHRYEAFLSEFLRTAGGPNPHWGEDEAGEVVEHGEYTAALDDSQKRAVYLALTRRACLISGGAGSGKSTLIRAIANLYRAHGVTVSGAESIYDDDHAESAGVNRDVILCAPTGKAARRIEEIAIGFDASTIHRALEYRPSLGGFQRHQGNPLTAAVVIVDEASMVDSELAYRLLNAIGPRTSVVLVGDHHQLPPVGPGALLRDAIARELLPMTILAHCHRQAGPLKRNCQEVLRGVVAPTHQHEGAGAGPWYVYRVQPTAAGVLCGVERLYTKILSEKLGYDPVADVQFLTAQHKGPLGTTHLNALLQRLHQKQAFGVTPPGPTGDDRRARPLVGDKVIQTRNNYDLDVMNGHQGIVVREKPLVVKFGDRNVQIPADCVGDVELAYCLSVHKVQGSEFPCAVVICHKQNSFSQHRNWLYTAVTRARKTCIILGDQKGIEDAARVVRNNQRRTLLGLLSETDRHAADR